MGLVNNTCKLEPRVKPETPQGDTELAPRERSEGDLAGKNTLETLRRVRSGVETAVCWSKIQTRPEWMNGAKSKHKKW